MLRKHGNLHPTKRKLGKSASEQRGGVIALRAANVLGARRRPRGFLCKMRFRANDFVVVGANRRTEHQRSHYQRQPSHNGCDVWRNWHQRRCWAGQALGNIQREPTQKRSIPERTKRIEGLSINISFSHGTHFAAGVRGWGHYPSAALVSSRSYGKQEICCLAKTLIPIDNTYCTGQRHQALRRSRKTLSG